MTWYGNLLALALRTVFGRKVMKAWREESLVPRTWPHIELATEISCVITEVWESWPSVKSHHLGGNLYRSVDALL